LNAGLDPKAKKGAPGLEQGRSPRKSAGPRKRRSAARMIAGGACYTSAGCQKGLKSFGTGPSAGTSSCAHKAGDGTNALSSAAAVGGRLRRTVRPEGQKGAPCFEEGRGPGKSAAPWKRRSAARVIAGDACCASAGGQKGLELTQRMQAKPGAAPKPQRRNL
jgi:hypothetical protein